MRVESFEPNAVVDHFEHHAESHDLTVLEVVASAVYAGRSLRVLHLHPAPAGGLWREIGAVYDAVVLVRDLQGEYDALGPGAFLRFDRVP